MGQFNLLGCEDKVEFSRGLDLEHLTVLEVAIDMDISPKKQKISPNWKARCPFHTERTPSFVIRPGRNCYQCYGCGNSGGPFILLFQISSLPITYLETRFGLNLKAGEDKKTLRILFENELTSNRGGTNSPYRRNIPIDLYIESFLNNP